MHPLSFGLEKLEDDFTKLQNQLKQFQFITGGNWDYDHGYFDRNLDEMHKVWIRIPFEVTNGTLDEGTDLVDATVKLGQPFVLKHLYNEGLEQDVQPRTYGGLVDQFQEPVDLDADIEQKWIVEAQNLLRQVENSINE